MGDNYLAGAESPLDYEFHPRVGSTLPQNLVELYRIETVCLGSLR